MYAFRKYIEDNKIVSATYAETFANEMDIACREGGGYWVSILSTKEFIPILSFLKKKGYNKSFLDVGCGCGDKLILASEQFKVVKGIEIVKKLFEFCCMNVKRTNFSSYHIYNMDAFNYDYSNEEVIFMFSPLENRELLKKLYIKIMDEMPKDSILIDSNPRYMNSYKTFKTNADNHAGYYIKR